MTEESISVIDVAKLHGRHKAYIFKVLKRLGIETIKEKSSVARGQKISYITPKEYELVKDFITTDETNKELENSNQFTKGVFYLIQLEPEHDPGRFKLGFASNIEERLRSHRTSAPFSQVLKIWPCKLLWEKTAIDSVTQGCERIHTEVFRAKSIAGVVARCDNFFSLMPELE